MTGGLRQATLSSSIRVEGPNCTARPTRPPAPGRTGRDRRSSAERNRLERSERPRRQAPPGSPRLRSLARKAPGGGDHGNRQCDEQRAALHDHLGSWKARPDLLAAAKAVASSRSVESRAPRPFTRNIQAVSLAVTCRYRGFRRTRGSPRGACHGTAHRQAPAPIPQGKLIDVDELVRAATVTSTFSPCAPR